MVNFNDCMAKKGRQARVISEMDARDVINRGPFVEQIDLSGVGANLRQGA